MDKVMDDVNKGNNGHNASIKVEMSSGTVMNGYKEIPVSRSRSIQEKVVVKGRVREEDAKEYINNNPHVIFS
jgi:hypothetical protein